MNPGQNRPARFHESCRWHHPVSAHQFPRAFPLCEALCLCDRFSLVAIGLLTPQWREAVLVAPEPPVSLAALEECDLPRELLTRLAEEFPVCFTDDPLSYRTQGAGSTSDRCELDGVKVPLGRGPGYKMTACQQRMFHAIQPAEQSKVCPYSGAERRSTPNQVRQTGSLRVQLASGCEPGAAELLVDRGPVCGSAWSLK